MLDALNLSLKVWLNTITDPPSQTEKINLLHNLLKIRLFLGALSRLYNAVGCRGLLVRVLHLAGDNAVERRRERMRSYCVDCLRLCGEKVGNTDR